MEDAVRESHGKKPRKFVFSKRSFCLRLMTFSFCAEALSIRETSHFVHNLFILPIYLNIDELVSCDIENLVITYPYISRYPEWYEDDFKKSSVVTPIFNHMVSRACPLPSSQATAPPQTPLPSNTPFIRPSSSSWRSVSPLARMVSNIKVRESNTP